MSGKTGLGGLPGPSSSTTVGREDAPSQGGPKWTPGPWQVETTGEGHLIRMASAIEDPSYYDTHHQIDYGHGCFVADDIDGPQCIEAEANAHLIAAAPELADAASHLLEAWDARTTRAQQIITGRSDADLQRQAQVALDDLRAALAKAQGGDQ